MTTAHRPTFYNALGGENVQGNNPAIRNRCVEFAKVIYLSAKVGSVCLSPSSMVRWKLVSKQVYQSVQPGFAGP